MHSDYDFLIVGGGMVADAAARSIRERAETASIGIVGEEPVPPFPRPALSKKLWTDPDFTRAGADPGTEKATGATVHLGTRVTGMDHGAHTVEAATGDTFGYGRLLVATGGHPRRVEGLEASDRVLYYRTLTDYERLRALAGGGAEIVVVGGGYIGSELAAALSALDCQVTVVFPDDVLGASMFPDELAARFQQYFLDAGVRLIPGTTVTGGSRREDRITLTLSDGGILDADAVVCGLGIEPAADFVDDAVRRSDDHGIVVDEHLRTSVADVWAAGDVAEYPDAILGRRRVEHVDNAQSMGAVVGRIMTGSDEVYDYTPMFYSDVFDHGYEAIGTLDASLETVVDPYDDGVVVYYLDGDEVVGVLLWDCEGGLDAARDLLARHTRPANPADLVGTVR